MKILFRLIGHNKTNIFLIHSLTKIVWRSREKKLILNVSYFLTHIKNIYLLYKLQKIVIETKLENYVNFLMIHE